MESNVESSDEVFNRVRKVLARMLKHKESVVVIDATLRDDLGVDSVDIWEIICKMEEEFNIGLQESDARDVNTVRDVVNVVKKKMGSC